MQQEQKIKMDPADNHGNGSPQQYRPLLLSGCFMAAMLDTGTQFLDISKWTCVFLYSVQENNLRGWKRANADVPIAAGPLMFT